MIPWNVYYFFAFAVMRERIVGSVSNHIPTTYIHVAVYVEEFFLSILGILFIVMCVVTVRMNLINNIAANGELNAFE